MVTGSGMRAGWLGMTVLAAVLLQGCASSPEGAAAGTAEGAWPVIYEPGYQVAQSELKAQHALFSVDQADGNEAILGAISFAAGVVSIGKDPASQARVKTLASQIQRHIDGNVVVIRGYAVNDKGLERAQQTAHWRAESLYYGLSRAGIPRASMLIETRVLEANSGQAGRQAVVIKNHR